MANVAVDLDGTIAEWGDDHSRCGVWMEGAAEALRDLILAGNRVIVHSCRVTWETGGGLDEVKRFVESGGFVPLEVNAANWQDWQAIEFLPGASGAHEVALFLGIWTGAGKPVAHWYVDDRAVTFDPESGGWVSMRSHLAVRNVPFATPVESDPEQPVLHFEVGCGEAEEFKQYEKLPVRVLAYQVPVPFSCMTVDGNYVRSEAGSYCVIDAKGFPYPCDPEIFVATHKEILDALSVGPPTRDEG